MTEFGIEPAEICHWNGYPWPRCVPKRDLTPEQSAEGGRALLEVTGLMSDLKLLLLLGKKAQAAADAVLAQIHSTFPELHVVRSLHPLGAKRTVDRQEQRRLWAGIADRLREGRTGA